MSDNLNLSRRKFMIAGSVAIASPLILNMAGTNARDKNIR